MGINKKKTIKLMKRIRKEKKLKLDTGTCDHLAYLYIPASGILLNIWIESASLNEKKNLNTTTEKIFSFHHSITNKFELI